MMWKVIINGVDIGMIETNYSYAKQYWSKRAAHMGYSIKLWFIPGDPK